MQGAKPVFVDVREHTFNIDAQKVLEKITDKTKAIIPVDLYGQIYNHKFISKIAEENDLLVIEDACQAVNATADGKKAGSFGDLGTFSFYATKNLITGEGGMITTDDSDYSELARRFRHHGQSEQTRYEYHDLGYNYRMMDVQAAIGLGQLENIDEFTKKRIRNASLLTKGLKNIKGIDVPVVKPGYRHVYHQYTIKVDGFSMTRDELLNKLREHGIGCGVYYPKPLHLHPWFLKLGYKKGDFPVSEKLSEQVLSLPVHPSLTDEDIQKIIDTIKGLSC